VRENLLNENIDHLFPDEGSAAVNGFDVYSKPGGAAIYWLFTGAQSFVSGLVRANI
jgi:hypothetical protein